MGGCSSSCIFFNKYTKKKLNQTEQNEKMNKTSEHFSLFTLVKIFCPSSKMWRIHNPDEEGCYIEDWKHCRYPNGWATRFLEWLATLLTGSMFFYFLMKLDTLYLLYFLLKCF